MHHERTHSQDPSERVQNTRLCHLCGMTFTYHASYKKHLKLHERGVEDPAAFEEEERQRKQMKKVSTSTIQQCSRASGLLNKAVVTFRFSAKWIHQKGVSQNAGL